MTAPASVDYAEQARVEFLQLVKNPAWAMAFEIAMGEWMREIATYHQGPIQAIADRAMLRQLNKTRDTITKRFLLDRISEIRKERTFDATEHPRDREGQFTRKGTSGSGFGAGHDIGRAMGESLGTSRRVAREQHPSDRAQRNRVLVDQQRRTMLDPTSEGYGKIPNYSASTTAGHQNTLGLLAQPAALDVTENAGDHQADVLTRTAAMTYALAEKTRRGADKQRIQYTITGPKGSRVEVPPAGEVPSGIDFDGGERVRFMAPIGVDNPVTVAGKVMDLGLIAGMDSDRASKLGSVTADIHDSLNTTDWGKRLNNVANVARVMSNGHPVAAQASAVAGLVQVLGPDAARAFGPKMRQLTYRYTGQEASDTQMGEVARSGRQTDSKGNKESITGFENRLITDLATHDLPKATEYKAALQAGSTPPSKGYLLDKDGNVVTESVGFADDWYTPFNLKRLPKLKHGSYVRTRGYGGITPEDITLAMHTGAQRVTVVSNSGVFSIEFDDRARSYGHRFGFGGTVLQRRYAKSLDAIRNNKVEALDEQGGTLSLNTRGYATALKDLKAKYPYFVKDITVHPPVQGAGGTPEKGTRDLGYVRPLSVRASGAKSGYADPSVAGQHQAYDQLDAYKLRKAQFGALQRDYAARSDTPAAATARPTTSSGLSFTEQRRQGENLKAAEANGQGTSASAYAPKLAEVIDADRAGQDLAVLRQVVSHDAKRTHADEEVSQLIEVLASGDKGADYRDVRNKWAGSATYRNTILDGLDETYGDHPNSALLSNLTNSHRPDVPSDIASDARDKVAAASDADPDAPDDMEAMDPEDYYAPHMRVPISAIKSSPAMQNWEQDLRIAAMDDPRLAVKLEKYEDYLNTQESDVRSRSSAAYDALTPEDRNVYDRIHHEVIQNLNAERGMVDEVDEVPEIPPPSRPKPADPGPQGVSRAFAGHVKNIFEAEDDQDAHRIGAEIIESIALDDDVEPAQTIEAIQSAIDRFENQEAELRRMGHAAMAQKMASAVEGMRDVAIDYELEDNE